MLASIFFKIRSCISLISDIGSNEDYASSLQIRYADVNIYATSCSQCVLEVVAIAQRSNFMHVWLEDAYCRTFCGRFWG